MRRFAALCLALLLALPALARAAEKAPQPLVTGVKVLDFGVFSSTVEKRQRVKSVGDGIRDQARDFALVRRGAVVEARLGTGIGLRYMVTGAPRGAAVTVDVAVTHPPLTHPDSGVVMTRSTAQYERRMGRVEHTVWSFDLPSDLVPGEYVVEILHEGRVLARQAFRVTVGREKP